MTAINSPADLRRVMGTDYEVSAQQWAAISAPLTPGVVIAGAGSGKTTLMAARVVYLVVTGQVRPEQVLGLTFTQKAAQELRTKIREALVRAGVLASPLASDPTQPDEHAEVLEPTVATYNAYAAALLTDHGLRIGHEPDTRVITDASRYQLGARAVERYTGEVQHLTDHPPTAIQNLLALDGAMTEHLVGPEQVREFDAEARRGFVRAREEELAGKARKTYVGAVDGALSAIDRRGDLLGLVETYRRLKRDLGLMDFGDQIALAARLAVEQPEVGALERDRFAVVLLDEYQDTSHAQAEMLSSLFSGPARAHGKGHPVTAVGDPNQAIYGWRGASLSNILNFATTFPHADGGEVPVLPLTVNRRSDADILALANRLAAPLYDALTADGRTEVHPLEAAVGVGPGTVAARVFETMPEELAALADSVVAAHDEGIPWAKIGVLTRDNAMAEAAFDALAGADIPVEIVGLSGLLRLPEVAEVVAALTLLHDVTDNAAMLTLLNGPRWSVGPRDLRLLALRAGEIAGNRRGRTDLAATAAEQLEVIADGIDPAEIPALSDALDDPGDADYSVEARERFELLARELRSLRSYAGEPILDVVRRIVDVTGVDIELASALSPAAAARRENLDLFLRAVAEFQAIDGDVTLPALLAYLTTEEEQGKGLDAATPSAADSVKLLTVHRAKGLEWDSVHLIGVCEGRFPSGQSRTLWTSSPCVLPAPLRGDAADLPQLGGFDKAALDAYRQATRDHDAVEELRLGYVAFTRAAHRFAVTSHLWGTRKTPYGPSDFQRVVRAFLEERGHGVQWLDKPPKGTANPLTEDGDGVPWPSAGQGEEVARRLDAAVRVNALIEDPAGGDDETGLDIPEAARVAAWDDELARLLAEARTDRADVVEVPLPSSLSATSLARLRDDAQAFLRDLARPMPRRPAPAARFGTRFHAWVEARFGQQALLEPDDLDDRGDAGIDDAELAELVASFEAGPFADRRPLQVEPAFALVLAGQVVRGRIDAVYAEDLPDGPGYLVVDWKTNRQQSADPLQLAVYRVAWAELMDVPLDRVRVAFHYVRSGETVYPDDLPDRKALEALLTSAQ